MIAVEPDAQFGEWFDAEGGVGKPRIGQVAVSYDPDESVARRRAREQFRWFIGGWDVNAELPGPKHFAVRVTARARGRRRGAGSVRLRRRRPCRGCAEVRRRRLHPRRVWSRSVARPRTRSSTGPSVTCFRRCARSTDGSDESARQTASRRRSARGRPSGSTKTRCAACAHQRECHGIGFGRWGRT